MRIGQQIMSLLLLGIAIGYFALHSSLMEWLNIPSDVAHDAFFSALPGLVLGGIFILNHFTFSSLLCSFPFVVALGARPVALYHLEDSFNGTVYTTVTLASLLLCYWLKRNFAAY